MKDLLTSRCLSWDLESTGVDVHNDRIVTACAAIVEAGKVLFQREWLIAVDVDIPAGATEVHGITTEHARKHGIPAEQGIKEIAGAIRYALHSSLPIVAYNGAFDASMLNAECVRHGLGTLEEFCGRPLRPVIDPIVLDKHVDPFRRGSRKLIDTCAWFDVALSDKDAHSAGADALAAVRVAHRLAERSQLTYEQLCCLYAGRAIRDRYSYRHNPAAIAAAFVELGKYDLDALHDRQTVWYREQAEGLGDYWAKKAHDARLAAARFTHRLDECDPADRDRIDQERAAAEDEAVDLEKRIASLSTDWPIRPLPVEVPA